MAQIPLRRLPRNFPGRGSFGEVGVMEFGLIQWRLRAFAGQVTSVFASRTCVKSTVADAALSIFSNADNVSPQAGEARAAAAPYGIYQVNNQTRH